MEERGVVFPDSPRVFKLNKDRENMLNVGMLFSRYLKAALLLVCCKVPRDRGCASFILLKTGDNRRNKAKTQEELLL